MSRNIRLTFEDRCMILSSGVKVETIVTEHLKLEDGNSTYFDNPVIALRMNNEILPFGARITVDATIEPVRLFSELGKRIYRHSLSYLLSYACDVLFPLRRLVIGHALGDGFYFTFQGHYQLSKEDLDTIIAKMEHLVEQNIPIELERLSYNDALFYFHNKG